MCFLLYMIQTNSSDRKCFTRCAISFNFAAAKGSGRARLRSGEPRPQEEPAVREQRVIAEHPAWASGSSGKRRRRWRRLLGLDKLPLSEYLSLSLSFYVVQSKSSKPFQSPDTTLKPKLDVCRVLRVPSGLYYRNNRHYVHIIAFENRVLVSHYVAADRTTRRHLHSHVLRSCSPIILLSPPTASMSYYYQVSHQFSDPRAPLKIVFTVLTALKCRFSVLIFSSCLLDRRWQGAAAGYSSIYILIYSSLMN